MARLHPSRLNRFPATRGLTLLAVLSLIAAGALLAPTAGMPGTQVKAADQLTKEQREELERRAGELNQQAFQLYQQGQLAPATKLLEQALALYQRLYAKAEYPQGHPTLAQTLANLSMLLRFEHQFAQAQPHAEQAVAMYERLYPKDKYPQGRSELAHVLDGLGLVFQGQREYARAQSYLEQAQAMRERLYPKEQYPLGHPDLVQGLDSMGLLLRDQGKHPQARPYFDQALAMAQRLYPQGRFPNGHPSLAERLLRLGDLLWVLGEYPQGRSYAEQALAMYERLYPTDQYPQGTQVVAHSLNTLGMFDYAQGDYAGSRTYFTRALAMQERLYSKDRYPHGHPDLADSLRDLGTISEAIGELARARLYYEQSLAMQERLYPKDRYPHGHPSLAVTLNNLGSLFHAQGEYAQALAYLEQALAMRARLYPKDQYPQGHPDLALGLDNVAFLLMAQGEYRRAQASMEEALAMKERLYPKDQYPRGHPQLAQSLSNLNSLFVTQGAYAHARPYTEQALAMQERLYLRDQFPQGHPDLARALNNLGCLFLFEGEYARAQPYLEQAVAMYEQLYPKEQYPQGHARLANSLNSRGVLFQAQGEYARAWTSVEQAVTMLQELTDLFVAAASGGEALNFVARLPRLGLPRRDLLLSVSRHLPERDAATYATLWRGQAAITRSLERRHRMILQDADAETQALGQKLLATRRELGHLLLSSSGGMSAAHRQRLNALNQEKAQLERQLAEKLPAFRRELDFQRRPHTDLVQKLPPRMVFIDLLRYDDAQYDPKTPGRKGGRSTPSYVAFVLRSGQPVQRVELGPAEPIETAVTAWRQAIAARQASPAAATLRQLVWEPLAAHFPAGTDTVLLAPDIALTALPWAALPGKASGTVLLEEYALAVVPHGSFLLERLMAEPPADKNPGRLVAVGGVRYDREAPLQQPAAKQLALGQAERGDNPLTWAFLPGTLREVEQLIQFAGPRPMQVRRDTEASTAQLMADLSDRQDPPRWLHLATHGFFADAKFRSALQLDAAAFHRESWGERATPGARNPMLLSGLVLAGANLPPVKDQYGVPQGDGGILTAEAIAGLSLPNLELAVLSACETGLGELAGGEGVFGLQRAFHVAGAQNVVASLWRVDDDATAALMVLFYYQLWQKNQPPIAALREAQLTLYRHPERIPELALGRGLELAKPVPAPVGQDRSPAKLWAGFVLSGLGR
jgi:CHAT domain-containing protein/Tfp pilus assembly protein PilF